MVGPSGHKKGRRILWHTLTSFSDAVSDKLLPAGRNSLQTMRPTGCLR